MWLIFTTTNPPPPTGRHQPRADTPPRTVTAGDGTHPTGMHTCSQFMIILIFTLLQCLNVFRQRSHNCQLE